MQQDKFLVKKKNLFDKLFILLLHLHGHCKYFDLKKYNLQSDVPIIK